MKTTIKRSAIAFTIDGATRKDVVYYILNINGRLEVGDYEQFLKDFNTKWRGYYSDAFQQWEREGLIKRSKGIYKATEIGKAYVNNPKIIEELLTMRRNEQKRRREILKEYWELKRKYDIIMDARENYKNLVNSLNKLVINS